MIGLSLLNRLPAVAAEVASAGAVLARAGLFTPFVPRPALLSIALRAPFTTLNFGSAIALHAATRPHAIALVDDRGPVTWAELHDRSCRLANAMLELAGPDDRVAFMLRNGREIVECYAACGLAGLAAVPVNTWSSGAEVVHIDQTQEPTLFVVDREFTPAMADISAPVWWVGDDDDEYETALADARAGAPAVRGGGRVIVHTSGTTGKPKGAERNQGASYLMSLVGFLERVPLRRQDVFLIAPRCSTSSARG